VKYKVVIAAIQIIAMISSFMPFLPTAAAMTGALASVSMDVVMQYLLKGVS
jgi:hypothetical protein